jgi:hypothetical protein
MAHMMITDVPIFDRDLRKASTLRPVTITDVRGYIKAHYLRRAPAVVRLCLLAELAGEPFGCVVYSEAPAESSKRLGGYTWDLARLYAEDWMPRNTETWMIGRSIRYIKQRHPDVRHLISYAAPGMRDATGAEGSKRDHTGTIYKASNWIEDGRTDDERKSARNDLMDPKTYKVYSRWSAAPPGSIKVPRVSKHRFIYHL